MVFITELLMKAFIFFPPTAVKCHSRLQLRLIHFCDRLPAKPKVRRTPTAIWPILVKLNSWQRLLCFSGSHTDFDSDEAITFPWQSPACCDFTLPSMLAIIQECSDGRYFSQETPINVRLSPATFLSAQSSFGVRRSRRTWGPGLS